jgi:hypothetical protein
MSYPSSGVTDEGFASAADEERSRAARHGT